MRTRKNRIAVRVTAEQFNKINLLIERSFFQKESILRFIVLGYQIQEKPAKEYTELFVVLRKLGSVIGNLNYRYGLRRYPIGEEIDQTARLVRETEKALSESNFIYYKKSRKRRNLFIGDINPTVSSPFKVRDDKAMTDLVESIGQFGILEPITVRYSDSIKQYEIISGNRRYEACKRLGKKNIPVRILKMSKDDAMIAMIDSNLCHREHILPSEKAFGYKMKLEAMNRQGYRTDISTLSQVGTKLNTAEELSQNADDSRTQIYRYIRLTNLIHELLDMVDVGRIAFTPAVELSYLTENEQRDLLTTIESEECTPSLTQAQQMRSLSENKELDIDRILSIITKPKANQKEYLKIPTERINEYFDERVTNKQREEIIIKALDHYSRYLKRNKDRGAR